MKTLLLVLLLCACGGPPVSLSLDPLFTPAEVAAIQDARDQWCEHNGWCPTWSADGEAHIQRVPGPPVVPGEPGVMAFTPQDDRTIVVYGTYADAWPDGFWMVIAHEMGHLQDIEHHGGPECLMSGEDHTEPLFTLACE